MDMHHLTSLVLQVTDEGDFKALTEFMSPLTGLRSLTLSGNRRSGIRSELEVRHLMTLTQLTQLSLNHYRLDRCQHLPMGIRSLQFGFCESPPMDFVEVLVTMTNLTSLSIDLISKRLRLFPNKRVTPSQFSEKLGRLKHLSIQHVLNNHWFLDAVGMLTQLTSLTLVDSKASLDPHIACCELSHLTELVELVISFQETLHSVSDFNFPQLYLPKLRVLELPYDGVYDNSHRALWKGLWKSFPCLRSLSQSSESQVST